MQTIQISLKDALTQAVSIQGYITKGTHTMVCISGVSIGDIVKLRPFSKYLLDGHNAVTLNLNHLNYYVVGE